MLDVEILNPAHNLGFRGIVKPQLPELNPLAKTEDLKKVEDDAIGEFKKEVSYDKSKPILKEASSGNLATLKSTFEKSMRLNRTQEKDEANSKDENGTTPLIVAANGGNVQVAKELWKTGAVLNCKSNDGVTPIMAAAMKSHHPMIKWLTSIGMDANEPDNDGRTSVMVLAFNGAWKIIKELIGKANFNAQDNHGRTALMAASQEGHINVVQLLLKNDADPCLKTVTGKTALFYAGLKKKFEVMEILAKQSPELLESKDTKGRTTLTLFAFLGKLDVVRFFKEKMKADINAQDEDGVTPLMAAIDQKHSDVVKYLLQVGAKTNLKKKKVPTATLR